MKATPIAAILLSLPVAALATLAMEPQQAARAPLHEQHPAHHQLFTLKYDLRTAPSDNALPEVAMDLGAAQIVPPADSVPAVTLGSLNRDPNMLVCYGWGCENQGR